MGHDANRLPLVRLIILFLRNRGIPRHFNELHLVSMTYRSTEFSRDGG